MFGVEVLSLFYALSIGLVEFEPPVWFELFICL